MSLTTREKLNKFQALPTAKRAQYSYSILRYVHDVATGEFVNVGVVVYSPQQHYFDFNLRKSLGRISDLFPDIKATGFRSLLRVVSRRLEEIKKASEPILDVKPDTRTFEHLLASVLPKDDSALVWANGGTGVSGDVSAVLTRLFERYVAKYDRPKQKQGRTDEDVGRSVRKSLQDRHLLEYFEPKTIEGKSDDVKFEFAWKNGIWHCIEPLSFDLSGADNIRDKAHKCAGEIVGISDSQDKFKVYLVLGKPDRADLTDAFEKAKGILHNVSSAEIYVEDEKDELFDKLRGKISAHF
ncbi:DUF3037 domain-containing protein [Caballeronia sp. ATUFL_F1_KS4A]|uniref:DUF3037 domain-containing protein n=1 Tax=Caballeronia sp. ATUFL_F1_KS4A TaxID=2921768 RepID=UPI00202927C0|nr:DUF3037 domain-containing protein [Caballeronia sp. ATUFL_F1_KS4A]